jgi:hypothetical protein
MQKQKTVKETDIFLGVRIPKELNEQLLDYTNSHSIFRGNKTSAVLFLITEAFRLKVKPK